MNAINKADILRREARILRGHYGDVWKEVIEETAREQDLDIASARRISLLKIFEPLLGYSVKELKVDEEDGGQMRVIP